jgi:tetratricopeptide (TPR) repeat protein
MIGNARSLCSTAAALVALAWSATMTAAAQPSPPGDPHLLWARLAAHGEPANEDDPGYALYRDGYRLVLDERWEQALQKFEELQRRFPASSYRDDAAYWSAYSLKHVRPKDAREAYRSFIEHYRQSSYFDDAVADLQEVETSSWHPAQPGTAKTAEGPEADVFAPGLQRLERELRRASRAYHRIGVPMMLKVDDSLDPETRLRMEALYAIGEATKDDQTFRALQRVAVAREEPVPLREAALEALVTFPGHETLPVFLAIAREDTDRTIQSYAVDLIAEAPADTSTKIKLLIDLYRTLPPSRREQRQTIFYTIADFGTEHAVNFLGDVALTSPDFAIRREAIYYLGSIGGPTARSLLMKILLKD